MICLIASALGSMREDVQRRGRRMRRHMVRRRILFTCMTCESSKWKEVAVGRDAKMDAL